MFVREHDAREGRGVYAQPFRKSTAEAFCLCNTAVHSAAAHFHSPFIASFSSDAAIHAIGEAIFTHPLPPFRPRFARTPPPLKRGRKRACEEEKSEARETKKGCRGTTESVLPFRAVRMALRSASLCVRSVRGRVPPAKRRGEVTELFTTGRNQNANRVAALSTARRLANPSSPCHRSPAFASFPPTGPALQARACARAQGSGSPVPAFAGANSGPRKRKTLRSVAREGPQRSDVRSRLSERVPMSRAQPRRRPKAVRQAQDALVTAMHRSTLVFVNGVVRERAGCMGGDERSQRRQGWKFRNAFAWPFRRRLAICR
jgi:hypothetical protein